MKVKIFITFIFYHSLEFRIVPGTQKMFNKCLRNKYVQELHVFCCCRPTAFPLGDLLKHETHNYRLISVFFIHIF